MRTHDASHERLLDELLESAAHLQSEFEGSPLAACSTCADVVAGISAMEATVARAGERERAALAELRGAGSREEPGAAEAALRAHVRERAAGPSALRRILLIGATLAAGALLFLQVRGPDRDPLQGLTDEPMGARVALVHPIGEVASYAPFEWVAQRPPGGWFRVRVFANDAGFPGGLLAESGRLDQAQWQPSDAVLREWPAEIVWTLEVFTGASESDAWTPVVGRARR